MTISDKNKNDSTDGKDDIKLKQEIAKALEIDWWNVMVNLPLFEEKDDSLVLIMLFTPDRYRESAVNSALKPLGYEVFDYRPNIRTLYIRRKGDDNK